MNKQTKISLILVITVILVILSVGLAFASAATPIFGSTCLMEWMSIDNDGDYQIVYVMGTAVWSQEENTITKTCTGHIYLGETKFNRYYFDLDEMRAYLADTYGVDIGNPFVLGPEDVLGRQLINLFKGNEIYSYDWSARVNLNGDFKFTAYFEIE